MKSLKAFNAIMILALLIPQIACNKSSDTQTRASFLGRWSVNRTAKLTYEVNITADPKSSSAVFISQFAGLGSSSIARAETNGNSIILDAYQVVVSGITVDGSGTLSGKVITWHYTILDGADQTNESETYTKL